MIEDDSGHDSVLSPPQICWQYHSGSHNSSGQTVESDAVDNETSGSSNEDMDQFDSSLIPVDTEPDFEFFGNHGTSANMVVLDWVIEHQIWVDCFNKHGLKLTVMDGVLQNLKARFKCWKTVIANLCAEADLKSQMQVFATCLGHMRFAHLADNAENEHCITCGSPKPEIAPSNSVHYLPLLPRIQAIIMDEQACNNFFQYHQTFQSEPGTYRDFFDGFSYQRICQMSGNIEDVTWDVFIAASSDGFQVYKNRTISP